MSRYTGPKARVSRRLGVDVAELTLGDAVGEAGLLLLLELHQVLGVLAATTAATVLTRRIRPPREGAVLLAAERHTLASALLAFGSRVTRQLSAS